MDRNQSFFYRFRLPFKLLGVFILAISFLVGAYYLTKLGPKKINPNAVYEKFDEAAGNKLLLETQEKEDEFRMRAEQRPPSEDDFVMLDEAIDGLSEYIAMRGGFHRESVDRREALYKLRDNYRGDVLYEESVQLENQSNEQKVAGNSKEALRILERALYVQRSLNERYSRSKYKDARRLTRLSREVDQLTALPLFEESEAAENAALQSIEDENYGRAKLLYGKSIELQKDLNLRFRGLQYADVQRLARLEQELSSLESSDIHIEIEEYREAGQKEEAEGNFAGAAESYQNAFRLQRQLNKDFPQSRFSGVRLAEELQSLRENALSRDLGDGIKAEMARLDEALKDRTAWKAIEIIRTLYPKVQQFSEQFPRSTILGKNALLKLQYLSAIEDDIGFLQDRIYGQLLPIEGVDGWRMLRTEVSQALYMSVMLKANPSRHVGDLLPVDSGNWDDAHNFGERVSWLTGQEVRLPTEDEFFAALGSLRYVDLRETSWNLENGDGVTHEIATLKPNAQGFCDLLGNVAEWLQSNSLPGDGEAYIAGGSVETSLDDLAEKPVEISNRRMRNRYAGFRIVVHMPEEQ
ncbi:formylglycine-generating enzyme family protein [Cerasicoccus arenae]|uniref:Sulfatase-modifying factor enzyme-like domain-containing protein n=1 Tax=Cerasicoccus arenae TaxID=424488 RepID=A0A8J3DJC1_9BACT|nr:SUMF1/EgtB/PvdO family nonheme iron enzyme [Cerasicoccus arenae]MBK1856812.1 SUMF1/EgtB/PvdO family nonheme iron enzyme [Cerasicoccus arenae]GHB99659.1 hypothetical protein GCM10007047_14940 [Cerasicoccus arenae]